MVFMVVGMMILVLYAFNNVEAAFQVNLTKPSDTRLYFTAYMSSYENINKYLFYQYPLFLKILTYPFNNPFLAMIIQLMMVVAIISLNSQDIPSILYAFILLNHNLVYTSVNFFKDNLILIIFLSATLIATHVKSKLTRFIIYLTALYFSQLIRPFYKYVMFISLLPLFWGKDTKIKKWSIAVVVGTLLVTIASNIRLILYIFHTWPERTLSPGLGATSILRLLLGPTPFRYILSKTFFVQPFLEIHGILLSFLNIIWIIFVFIFTVLVIKNIRHVLNLSEYEDYDLFLIFISFITAGAYLIAYGSADIRQRALIHTLLFIPTAKKITCVKLEPEEVVFGTTLGLAISIGAIL